MKIRNLFGAILGATLAATVGYAASSSVKLFGSSSGDATVTVAAAAGTATIFQLPASNGTNTYVLQTDGSGVTSWVANTGGATTTGSGTTHTMLSGTNHEYWFCTGSCTITVPAPVAGKDFCVANIPATTGVITFSAIGSSAMYPKTDGSAYGTAGTGTMVSGGANGDKICLIGLDSTHYVLGAYAGTITVN